MTKNINITVAHLITRLDSGGSATNTIISADRLREYGFTTKLIYGPTKDENGAISKLLDSRGIDYACLQSLVREIHPVKDFSALISLVQLFKHHRFDLIHTHTSKAGLLGRIAARICGIPCVHTPHGHVFYGYFGKFKTSLFISIERFAAKLSNRIISLTDEETRESLERRIGKPEQYVTIPSGIDLATFLKIKKKENNAFRSDHKIPAKAMVVLSIGRLTHIKGFDVLFKAFAQADFKNVPAYLVVAGDGEERDRLAALAGELNIENRTIFTGWLENTQEALAAADIFILASRNEGMGRAFIEAMASGLPVIGPRTGGVPTIIQNEKTGMLVDKDDVAGFASAISLLANDARLRMETGENAREFVYTAFDEKHMIDALARVYGEVLSNFVESVQSSDVQCSV